MTPAPTKTARRIFASLGPTYPRWAAILGLGQDRRWRQALVDGMGLPPGSLILDLAAGTGSITETLRLAGHRVVAADQSLPMLIQASHPLRVVATAEELPFRDHSFDGLTTGYLLRYVDDLEGAMGEMARTVRPGGELAVLEFGRPRRVWGLLWLGYTRLLMPLLGLVAGGGWRQVTRFLGPSIDRFWKEHDLDGLTRHWEASGVSVLGWRRMSLGAGMLFWARRR